MLSSIALTVALTGMVAAASTGTGRAIAPAVQAAPAPVAVSTADPCGPSWVTSWLSAPQAAPGDPALDGATLRLIVHPQVTGSGVRVRLSNAYGTAPLTIGAVSAARSAGAARVMPGTLRPVTFGKRLSVVVPAGADVVSDPIPLIAEAGQALAVSVFLPVAPKVLTTHPVALQTSYLSRSGDFTLSAGGDRFAGRIGSWPLLTGVEVLAPQPVNAVIAVGDSITDGIGSDPDADERWSDALAGSLAAAGGSTTMAVLNAGISGNRLLDDDPGRTGASPIDRFGRDIGGVGGATDVVLHIGTNDIAAGRNATEIVAGLLGFTDRAKAAGKRVFLTTITPSDVGPHGTAAAVRTRTAVNAWIRTRGGTDADGVFDFAAAVADPVQPSRLARAYDSGDGLHLSVAGYRALAGAVDQAALTGSPCLAGSARIRTVALGN
jgi:lysophospholipase L1-like esterase